LEDEGPNYVLKMVALGDGAVGKTSCIMRYTQNSFGESYKATIGTNIAIKNVEIEHRPGVHSTAQIVIWDLAGQAQFARVRRTYTQNAEAGLLVFDTTRRETYDNVKNWYKEITDGSPNISLILCGNKVDLVDKRTVSKEEAQGLADELSLSYFETSAKDGTGVDDAFKMLAFQMIEKFFTVNEI